MTRNFCRCALSVVMLAGWALAQTPTQTPQQNYPNESERTAPQAQQQQQQPTTPNQQAYPEENPMTPTTNASPQTASQPHPLSPDDALKSQLQRALAANPRLSDVQPVVNGGQVTLTGTVPTEADRTDAKRAIEQVSGVNKVVDELTIGTTSHTPPGGNASEGAATSMPQSDVYGKGASAQGAARGCECPKGQANGKYPGTDEPCACSGTTTHSGESLPKSNRQPPPIRR
jgi:hypothetical protein